MAKGYQLGVGAVDITNPPQAGSSVQRCGTRTDQEAHPPGADKLVRVIQQKTLGAVYEIVLWVPGGGLVQVKIIGDRATADVVIPSQEQS